MAFEQLMAEAQIKKEKDQYKNVMKAESTHKSKKGESSSDHPTSTEFNESWDREKR